MVAVARWRRELTPVGKRREGALVNRLLPLSMSLVVTLVPRSYLASGIDSDGVAQTPIASPSDPSLSHSNLQRTPPAKELET